MSSSIGGPSIPGQPMRTGESQAVKGAQLGKAQQMKQVKGARDSIAKAPPSAKPSRNPNDPKMQRPKSDTPFPQALKKWQGNRQAYRENPASRELEALKKEADQAMEALARALNDFKVGVMAEKSLGRAKDKYLSFKGTFENKWSEVAQAFNRNIQDPTQRIEEFLKLPTVEEFKPAGASGFVYKPKIPELTSVQQSRFEQRGGR